MPLRRKVSHLDPPYNITKRKQFFFAKKHEKYLWLLNPGERERLPLRREVFHLKPPHNITTKNANKNCKQTLKILMASYSRRGRACPPRREVFHLEPQTSVMRLARPHRLDVFNVIYVKQARYNRTTLSSTYFKYSRYPQIVRN